mgnify:CR=1 FL=1|tara:strand:- start:761 stop:1201 length:441 start_codon:yes stop_codon:yes gene_type:complete
METSKLGLSLFSLLVATPMLASAETPDIKPGQWEYQSTMRMSAGGQAMPAQMVRNKDCVRQEDLTDPDLFGGDELKDCEASGVEQSRSRLRYTLTCAGPDGSPYTMTADIKLQGETMEGTMQGDMESPMGPMRMRMELSGKRIGDC